MIRVWIRRPKILVFFPGDFRQIREKTICYDPFNSGRKGKQGHRRHVRMRLLLDHYTTPESNSRFEGCKTIIPHHQRNNLDQADWTGVRNEIGTGYPFCLKLSVYEKVFLTPFSSRLCTVMMNQCHAYL